MKSKVLIVDDEVPIRLAFEMILEDEEYEVFTAEDFDGAVESIRQNEPDIVIADIILGGHTGVDLLSWIKSKGLNCPVIMITGEPNLETSTKALRLGAFDYIPKPVQKETLQRVAFHALRQKELMDEKHFLENENLAVRRNMEAIFDSLRDGIITVDENLNVIEVNAAVADICGWPVPDIRGEAFGQRLPKCKGACIDVLRRVLRSKKSVQKARVECKRPNHPVQLVSLSSAPLKSHDLDISGAVLVIRNETELARLEKQLHERYKFHKIIGKSEPMQHIYDMVENLSQTDTTVLITGKSGTGKELIAGAIHHHSSRKEMPFVKVNCGALPENLLESELFGHVKGAFTGAVSSKIGRFKMADQGIILLDEIGDISPLVQLKLLRVLQEKEFERVGDPTPVRTNVRVFAATNRDLKKMVRTGRFREDLYYRIKVVEINLPPLIDRREDIPLLTEHFIDHFNQKFNRRLVGVSDDLMAVFMAYPWPGNIRELRHAVEHGFVLCKNTVIRFEHMPREIKDFKAKAGPSIKPAAVITREDIIQALVRTEWNKAKAARVLGISRRTIYRRIDAFAITRTDDLDAG